MRQDRRTGGEEGPDWILRLLALLATFATVWFLKAAATVVMPVACALLIALAIWPVARGVRDNMPSRLHWLGPASALLIVFLLLALFLVGLGLAARQVAQLLAEVAPEIEQRVRAAGIGGLPDQGNAIPSLRSLGGETMRALGITVQALAMTILILFLVLLMLTESRNWHSKIVSVTAEGGYRRWADIGASVGQKFRAFFLMRLFLGTLTAFLYVGWLALFGIDYLLLWGLLAVLLNFIPTVGSLIAGILPVAFALVQRDLATAGIVASGLLAIEQVMGNFVDPKLMGRRLSVSPLVVLVSLAFWSWLWGLPGAFLAVPLTVLVTMVLAHFEALKPIALLLTDQPDLDRLEEYRLPR